jgi:curli biogenesis system outer membrane secretion channel CsgG
MRKKILYIMLINFIIGNLSQATTITATANATIGTPTTIATSTIGLKEKLKIAVASFKVKAPKYKDIDPEGEAFADMLITALYKTGYFEVLEREILKEMEEELSLSKEEEKEYKIADVMVAGAITGFEPNYKGFILNIATIFNLLSCLFGVLGKPKVEESLKQLSKETAGMKIGFKKSYFAIDIRVVRVKTREVVGATRIETITKDVVFGSKLASLRNDVKLAAAFVDFENTPIEKAIYESLEKAVDYITKILPLTLVK